MTPAAAAWYVRRLGFRLVTQEPVEKIPHLAFFPHGATSATTDLQRIGKVLRRHPDALLAARVGEQHMVLDVDVRHGGPEALARLLAHFGDLPETWRAITPTGGEHIWFRHPGFRPKGKLCEGVECITGNRLITLPPSERLGRKYRWEHDPRVPLAEAPRWLVDALRPPEPPKPLHPSDVSLERRMERARLYLERVDSAISGNQGHTQTFWVAQILTRGFELPIHEAFEVMTDWNCRCAPPWSDYDLKRKLHEAARRGSMPYGKMLERKNNAA